MNKNLFYGHKEFIFLSCGSAIIFTFSSLFIWLPFAILFIAGLIYSYGEKTLLGIIIIDYLTTFSKFFGENSVYINLLLTGLLFYMFIKKFGFQFEKYPKVPKEILLF